VPDQVRHQAVRHLAAVRRHVARADHGHGPLVLRQQFAARVEDGRRVVDVGQASGIALVGEGVRLDASALETLQRPRHVNQGARGDGDVRDLRLDARVDQPVRRGMPGALHVAEPLDDAPHALRADARQLREGDPVGDVVSH